MVKIPTKMSACFLAMRFHRYGCTGQRIQDLFASTRIWSSKNIEKTEITLQQLELNKEELIGKSISESHIREKRMVWSWVSNETGKATESGLI
jgi:CPA2 family monovalent cation:H+ antiporter-2